jgi:hypothetical protein
MILSVHLADVGALSTVGVLRKTPTPDQVPGLRYGFMGRTAPLHGGLMPKPEPGRVGLVAAWDGDDALDRFLADDSLARRLDAGWHVRLDPLHAYGSWSSLPGLEQVDRDMDDDEPVAVLTLGRLRISQTVRFLRASAAAEGLAAADPAVLASTACARLPSVVATFSLWRTFAAMRDYAAGRSGEGHLAASSAHKDKPFHHESVFIRFRPYGSHGSWNGHDPLAEVAREALRP